MQIISDSLRGVSMTFYLYGDVTKAREKRERAILHHRLEQLAPSRKWRLDEWLDGEEK